MAACLRKSALFFHIIFANVYFCFSFIHYPATFWVHQSSQTGRRSCFGLPSKHFQSPQLMSGFRESALGNIRGVFMTVSGTASDVKWTRPSPRGSKDIVFGGRSSTLSPRYFRVLNPCLRMFESGAFRGCMMSSTGWRRRLPFSQSTTPAVI